MKNNKILIVVLTAALLGTAVSMLLTREHYYAPIIQQLDKKDTLHSLARSVCGGKKNTRIKTGCEKIAASPYSQVGGMPLADLGVVFFIIMTLFSLLAYFSKEEKQLTYKYILFWLLIFGSGVDIALLGISLIKLKTLCGLCSLTYLFLWTSAIILGIHLFKNDNNPSEFKEILNNFMKISTKDRPVVVIISIAVIIASFGLSFGFRKTVISKRNTVINRMKDQRIKQILIEFNKEPARTISTKGMHLIGNPDAPVTIIKFSDFMCPACARASHSLDDLVRFNRDKVKVYFSNYPLDNDCNITIKRPFHIGSCYLAKGAICADDAGKFHEYYKIVFSRHFHRADLRTVYGVAQEIGILTDSFKKCMVSLSADKALQAQMSVADNLNVNATPTIYINGKEFKYRTNKYLLKKIIDQELRNMDRKKTMRRYKSAK